MVKMFEHLYFEVKRESFEIDVKIMCVAEASIQCKFSVNIGVESILVIFFAKCIFKKLAAKLN